MVSGPSGLSTTDGSMGIALGDFNKDGQIDLAVTCRDKTLVNILLKKNMNLKNKVY